MPFSRKKGNCSLCREIYNCRQFLLLLRVCVTLIAWLDFTRYFIWQNELCASFDIAPVLVVRYTRDLQENDKTTTRDQILPFISCHRLLCLVRKTALQETDPFDLNDSLRRRRDLWYISGLVHLHLRRWTLLFLLHQLHALLAFFHCFLFLIVLMVMQVIPSSITLQHSLVFPEKTLYSFTSFHFLSWSL